MALYDRVKFTTATTGTGTITVGSAVSGFRTPAGASIPNAGTFPYILEDGAAWEIGNGTYTTAGTTVARSLISSSTGALLSLSGSAIMLIGLSAAALGTILQAWDADLDAVASSGAAGAWTAYSPTLTPNTGSFTSASATGRYLKIGKTVWFVVAVTITTNGTASNYYTVSLPATSANLGHNQIVIGKETLVVGTMALGNILNNSLGMAVGKYDGTYLGGDGYKVVLNGCYESA